MLKKYFLGIIISVLFFGFFTSCVEVQPVVRYQPLTDSIQWVAGKQYAVLSNDSLKVLVTFNSRQGNLLEFDVEVVNLSKRTILVSPENIYCRSVLARVDSLMNSAAKNYALDPEQQIVQMESNINQATAAQQNELAADCCGDLFLVSTKVAVDQVTKQKDTPQQQEEFWRQREYDKREQHLQQQQQLSELKNSKFNWENYALRKTHLLPNNSMRGSVYFYDNQPNYYYILTFPLGNSTLETGFRKMIVKPAN